MQIYDFIDKQLVCLGDLHGNFKPLLTDLKRTTSKSFKPTDSKQTKSEEQIQLYSNMCFVVCGDCSFGFNKKAYYEQVLNQFERVLKQINSILIFVRGNHDDKSYFKNNNGFSYENIIFAEDYSVLRTKSYTSLLVGGAVSLDRAWRMAEEQRLNKYHHNTPKRIYWQDEVVTYNNSLIEELNACNIKIDSIITHSAPLNIINDKYENFTVEEYFKIDWFIGDDTLKQDVLTEWNVLSQIYDDLINNGHKLKCWVFGHYHKIIYDDNNNCIFYGLPCFKQIYSPLKDNNGFRSRSGSILMFDKFDKTEKLLIDLSSEQLLEWA